jgi:ATP-dependent Clp protease ATP-binding subunit ClpA
MNFGKSYSTRARTILNNAEEQARQLGHRRVEPEHLLLAVLQADATHAQTALQDVNITYEKAQQEVVRAKLSVVIMNSEVTGMSERGKKALRRAADEATYHESIDVTPEHLLMGVVREAGMYEGVLLRLNTTPEAVRDALYERMGLEKPAPTDNMREARSAYQYASAPGKQVNWDQYVIDERTNVIDRNINKVKQLFTNQDTQPGVIVVAAIVMIALAFMLNRSFGAFLLIALPIGAIAFLFVKLRDK